MGYTRYLRAIEKWPLGKFWVFLVKQAWAALFGGLMLFGIIVTSLVDLPWLPRYDWLFLWAITVQIFMIATKLEKPREIITIMAFHLVGLGMELFKTAPGIASWVYPEDAFFRIATVPLFSGFMYAAVGSYIARVWRMSEFRFTHYPPRIYTALLAIGIYVNFFTHHYFYDLRWLLFAFLAILYWRTVVFYKLVSSTHSMPLLLGFFLVASVIWFAENVATYFKIWLYPNQSVAWELVPFQKIGSWLLLVVISFVMVDLLRAFYRNIE